MKLRTYKNFSDLRFLLKKRSALPTDFCEKPLPRLASNDDGLSEEELFKNEMKGVNRLRWDSVPVRCYCPVEIHNESEREESGLRLLLDFVQGKTPIDLEVTGEYVEGAPHPIGRFLLGYLRTGHYSVEAHLDLQGFDAHEYRCTPCGRELEKLQRLGDAPLTDCPACGKAKLHRLVSAAGFRLKGGGWYETDFKKDGKKNLHASHGAAKAPAEKKDTGAGESAKAAEPKKAPSAAPAAKPSAA